VMRPWRLAKAGNMWHSVVLRRAISIGSAIESSPSLEK
jgi:hypothetical protein